MSGGIWRIKELRTRRICLYLESTPGFFGCKKYFAWAYVTCSLVSNFVGFIKHGCLGQHVYISEDTIAASKAATNTKSSLYKINMK